MKEKLRFLGMDVHAERLLQRLPNRIARYEVLARFLIGWSRYAS